MKPLIRSLCLAVLALSAAAPAAADIPSPPALEARSYILLDFASGQVLAESNSDLRVEPASITKIMTSYITFDELKKGNIHGNDDVLISEKAWRTQGSRTFVEVGKTVKLSDLEQGSIVQSGNDATVAIAEHIAGDESVFAQLMNKHAAAIGMKGSNYENATGLPSPNHYTTAHDVALLSQALIRDFPEGYKMFSEREFTFGHGSQIRQGNRNLLLDMDPGADGIKTGHTEAAGYCLAGSSVRDGRRLIAVVMGTAGTRQRAQAAKTLLDYGFRFFENATFFGADKPAGDLRVWKGATDRLSYGVPEAVMLALPRGTGGNVQVVTQLSPNPVIAPVSVGQILGSATLSVDGKVLRTVDLVALQPIEQGGFFVRLIDTIRLWLGI